MRNDEFVSYAYGLGINFVCDCVTNEWKIVQLIHWAYVRQIFDLGFGCALCSHWILTTACIPFIFVFTYWSGMYLLEKIQIRTFPYMHMYLVYTHVNKFENSSQNCVST